MKKQWKCLVGIICLLTWIITFIIGFAFFVVLAFVTWNPVYLILALLFFFSDLIGGNVITNKLDVWIEKEEENINAQQEQKGLAGS